MVERHRQARVPAAAPPAVPRPRWRFKRRGVLVPLVTVLVVSLAVLAGLVWLVLRTLGMG